jgi:hypothetical protein
MEVGSAPDIEGAKKGDPVTVMVPNYGWAKAKFLEPSQMLDPWGQRQYRVSLLQTAGWEEKFSILSVPADQIRRGHGLLP